MNIQKEILKDLQDLLKDKEWVVRKAAAYALGNILEKNNE